MIGRFGRRLAFAAGLLVLPLALGAAAVQDEAGRAPAAKAANPSLDRLSWMTGGWRLYRRNMLGQVSVTEEHWIAPSGGTMMAVNRTVRDGRTTEFEFLRIVAGKDGIFYIAHPNARPGTRFKLTRQTADEVVFENPENEFPKIIRYLRKGEDRMEARIANEVGGRAMTFAFERIKD